MLDIKMADVTWLAKSLWSDCDGGVVKMMMKTSRCLTCRTDRCRPSCPPDEPQQEPTSLWHQQTKMNNLMWKYRDISSPNTASIFCSTSWIFFISINRKSWEFFDSEGLGQSYLQPRQSTGPQLSSVSASSLRRSNFLLRFSHPALLPAAEAPPPLTSLRLHSCCCYSLVWSPQWQDQLGCTDCAWCSCDRPHSPTRPRRSPSTGLSAPPSGLGRNGRPLRGDEPKRPNCGDIWSLRWRRATLKRTSGQVRSWKSTGTVWWNCKFSPDPCTNEDLADLVFLLKKETKLFFYFWSSSTRGIIHGMWVKVSQSLAHS